MREWMPEEFMGVWERWPDAADVASRAQVAQEKSTKLLEADEKEERSEETKRWSDVKEQVRLGQSVGFREINDKVQKRWSGEEDVSNVAQLVAQADKRAALWQEGDAEWDIRKSGICLGQRGGNPTES